MDGHKNGVCCAKMLVETTHSNYKGLYELRTDLGIGISITHKYAEMLRYARKV